MLIPVQSAGNEILDGYLMPEGGKSGVQRNDLAVRGMSYHCYAIGQRPVLQQVG